MSWIGDRINGILKLTTTQRQAIWTLFGSFRANKFANNSSAQIVHGYEQNIDVYSVIKKITDTSSTVPWIVEERQSDGTWIEILDTSIHELMSAPNVSKGYTWNDIEEQTLTYLLATGNNYMIGNAQMGRTLIEEVDILPPNFTEIVTNNDFFLPNVNYQFNLNQNKRTFTKEEVEHTRFFNPGYNSVTKSFEGLSLISVAAMAVQVGNDRWDADANLLQNRGAVGLITDKSNRPMSNEEAAATQESFNAQTAGTGKFGMVKVTNKDLNYIQMAMSPTDLQLIEKGVITLRAICNVFGLDSSLFNDPANKTFNNRKEAEKALYTNAVMPISAKIAAAHTMFIAKNHFPNGRVRMRQDFSRVEALQIDKRTEAQKDKIRMDGINVVLNMPISSDAKQRLLISDYDFTEDEAIAILTPAGAKNVQLDILGSISPLLANKLVEKLSDEEIRKLLNL